MTQRPGFAGRVEFSDAFRPGPKICHVLFDFDGTLSLIRQGWPDVMVPMFVEFLPQCEGESEEDLRCLAWDDIMRLNGKQTIYQMIQLAQRIRERGGTPRDPLWYKYEYLQRLNEHIEERKDALRLGGTDPDSYLVFGARQALQLLTSKGLTLYLASGTDEEYVIQEAEMLGIEKYFAGRIYGARDDYQNFSKKMVIDRILSQTDVTGESLLAFGDG